MIDDWISFAISGVCGVTAIICLFEGTRRIGAHGVHRTAVLMVVLGALFCASWGALIFWEHLSSAEAVEEAHQKSPAMLRPPVFAKDMPAEKREKLSLSFARAVYLERGLLVTYTDIAGAQKLFAPGQADIKRRDSIITRQARPNYTWIEEYADALLWWLWGLLAMLIGYLFSREKPPQPAVSHNQAG